MKYLLVAAMMFAAGANAGELDNEKSVTNAQVELSRDLPQTLVIRVSEASGKAEVLESKKALSAQESTKLELAFANFTPANTQAAAPNELDRDTSQNSYYLYYNYYNWYYPNYYYAGYNFGYSPYWSYYWGGYSYYFYRWGYW